MSPEELLIQAKRRIQVADHFLTQTYPLVQDPKLLINVLDGVLRAVEELIDAMLQHERAEGRIPVYHEGNFTAKLALIKGDLAKRYNFGHIDIAMIAEMQELLHAHKESSVEFSRRGQFVMAHQDYRLATLSVDKIKTYLMRTKSLYTKVHDNLLPA